MSTAVSDASTVLGAGSWTLRAATGFDLPNAVVIPENSSSGTPPPNCTITYGFGSLSPELVLPAYHGNLSSGRAPVWWLSFLSVSTYTNEFVVVTNGVASRLEAISGPDCFLISHALPSLPNDVVDSSVAAATVYAGGGDRYLGTHPGSLSLVMDVFQSYAHQSQPISLQGTPGSALWGFDYVPCGGPFSTNPTGPSNGTGFFATVNATDGTLLGAGNAPVDCLSAALGPPSIFSALHFGTPQLVTGAGSGGTIASQGCTSGDYCYEVPVTNVSAGVDPADAGFSVLNNTAVLSPVPDGYAVTSGTGQVIVYSLGSQEIRWLPGVGNSTTPFADGDTLWVDMGTSNPGGYLGGLAYYGLWVVGEGAYYDSAFEISLSPP